MKIYTVAEIPYKRILGRNIKDVGKSENPLSLFWGASSLEINVKSKEVWILVSADYDVFEPWISVEINGYPVSRFMVDRGKKWKRNAPRWICVARNINEQKENLVSIIKDTQPMSDDSRHMLLIHQIGLSDDGTFCQLPQRKMNIEFVGDSITSGEGLAGFPEEQDWITQWFCAGRTYAVQLAKMLDADFSVMSQCGWGVCWGWDGNINSALPPHYENVCSILRGDNQKKFGAQEKFSFDKKNDYVIVNLGTNDEGAFFQPPWKDSDGIEYLLQVGDDGKPLEDDSKVISEAVKTFLKKIREHNPEAGIIWCYGMIKLKFVPEFISRGIADYKAETGDEKVYLLPLDSMEDVEVAREDKGSRGHPGPKTHRLAAQKLYDFIENL